MLAQEAQHPLAADGDPPMGEPRADLAITLAVDGVAASTARMAVTISLSLTGVFGPRFAWMTGAPGAGANVRYTVDRGTRKTAQIMVSGYRRPVPGLTAHLIADASSTRP